MDALWLASGSLHTPDPLSPPGRRLERISEILCLVYFDKGTLATVGRCFAVADIGPLHFSGLLAWLTWIAVPLFFLIGFRNRLIVLIQYAWAYATFRPGAQIILTEDKFISRSN